MTGSIAFLLCLLLLLFAFRWPALLWPGSLNPDEAQLLAQGITLAEDGPLESLIFYRSVQSGSAGPILTYPLLVPHFLGFDIDYGSGRTVGLLLLWLSAIALYLTLRLVTTEVSSRLAAFIAVLCLALSNKPDFLHYSSEHPSLPLLAVSSLILFRLYYKRTNKVSLNLLILGTVLGAIPFAKLQSSLIALAIAGLAALVIALERGVSSREKARRLILFTAGGLAVPILFFSTYLLAGVFGYFWEVYIVNNYHYKERGEPISAILDYYTHTPKVRQFNYEIFFFGACVFILIRLFCWLADRPRRGERPWLALGISSAIAAASWLAVIAPGRGFPHYLLLTVYPMSLVCGVLMGGPDHAASAGASGERDSPRSFRLRFQSGQVLALLLMVLPLAAWTVRPAIGKMTSKYITLDLILTQIGKLDRYPPPPSSLAVLRLKRPGDRLTVWGWRADYHVETQLPMGTRSACPEFQIRDVPLRDFYRRTALAEFKKNRPTFFIDATGRYSINFTDRQKYGHHTFPDLAAYVRENYRLATDFTEDLLYIRNDRAREIEHAKSSKP